MEKQYNHLQFDGEAQALWEQHKVYLAENHSKPLFSIDTPPPTVSGSLHIGHICSYTQTDIMARFKRMSGFSVFYPFGFDDNGLATERFVEKKQQIKAYQIGRSEFIKKCLEETKIAEHAFKSLFKKIALSANFDSCYSTISKPVRALSQASFISLYEKEYVYRKKEVAPFCTTCQTSVAQAELEDEEKKSYFNDIIFSTPEGTPLTIATTRPELLPACVALFYHPSDKQYTHLKGKAAIVPIFNQEISILADEKVNPEKGTGLVMCCTFGDKTDIEWYKQYQLPYRSTITRYGKMESSVPYIGNLSIQEARKKILELLQENGCLGAQTQITHSVNVHERCKKDIEFFELDQWFIKILSYKDEFLSLADQIEWHPDFMKTRYKNWVENLQWDWCISRQRFYGIPFPVWYCDACGQILLAPLASLPIDPQEQAYPGGKCTKCQSTDIRPETDIMDTWNTSSLSPQICNMLFHQTEKIDLEATSFIPMSLRPQAHDIIRTWAFYTIVKSWMHTKKIPWKNVAISGHVLNPQKEKISKSRENTALTPENLLNQYPADVIRFWTASGMLGQDVSFSENQFKIGQRLVTKLWNAFRFLKEHLENVTPETPTLEELPMVHQWILQSAHECFMSYKKHLENYEHSLALHDIETFFWKNFCDNYLELIKDSLFHPENYSPKDLKITQNILYQVGFQILQWYAPFLPHITETLYQILYRKHEKVISIHQTEFTSIDIPASFEKGFNIMQQILFIIGEVRRLKTEHQLSLKVPLSNLLIYASQENNFDQIKAEETLLKGITHAEKISYQVGMIQNKLENKENKMTISLSLEQAL